jgi:hypothetical protein
MIQPEDIRRKAERLYPDFLRTWIEGKPAFFPRIIPARRTPELEDLAGTIESIRRLREGSKEILGTGYTVQWQEINSRKFGRNKFPARIVFDTPDDFLRFLGKQREFQALVDAVTMLRSRCPDLEPWIQANFRTLVDVAGDLQGLLEVLDYFRVHPKPNLFARELPLAVDTKFIERHQRILREWFDLVLPRYAIRADEEHFERRYGLRYAEPHLYLRMLDPDLGRELGIPYPEFSLPLHTLGALVVRPAVVFIVENKVNLLTLPAVRRAIGLGALGNAVTQLRYLPWLRDVPIVYWGDLDIEGFGILSSLRSCFPQTESMLMDADTLERWRPLATPGTARTLEVPPLLTGPEQAGYLCCRDHNLRLEQERIPQHEVLRVLGRFQGECPR